MKIFITGGAGFIGSNTAKRFIADGHEVVIFDNLSREGVEKNLDWLRGIGKYEFIKGDVTNYEELQKVFAERKFDVVFHFAAQVAVTTSVADPRSDFLNNILGAFNLLESVRTSGQNPVVIYSSTNKVYGGMEEENIVLNGKRYELADYPEGVDEEYHLDFHSPYGCSKGAADQYFHDYSRIYGLRTIVFRQSCIYGFRQFGKEDQGWVAWFIIAGLLNKPMTIYGDGFQVRDVLFIDDLVEAYVLAIKNIDKTAGKIYNLGGGADKTLSLVEFLEILEEKLGRKLGPGRSEPRAGDQKIYVSNVAKAGRDFGWAPKIAPQAGIDLLFNWVKDNLHLFT